MEIVNGILVCSRYLQHSKVAKAAWGLLPRPCLLGQLDMARTVAIHTASSVTLRVLLRGGAPWGRRSASWLPRQRRLMSTLVTAATTKTTVFLTGHLFLSLCRSCSLSLSLLVTSRLVLCWLLLLYSVRVQSGRSSGLAGRLIQFPGRFFSLVFLISFALTSPVGQGWAVPKRS